MLKSIPTWQTPRLTYTINDGVSNVDFERIEGNILNLRNTGRPYGVATGKNAYEVEIEDIPKYEEFVSIGVKFAETNTSAATLNLNGLGPRPIIRNDGRDIGLGEIRPNLWYLLIMTESRWQIIGVSSSKYPYGEVSTKDRHEYMGNVPTIAELDEGTLITVKFLQGVEEGAVLNINSLGARVIRNYAGQRIDGNTIGGNTVHSLVYEANSWRLTSPTQYIDNKSAAEVFQDTLHGVRTRASMTQSTRGIYQVDVGDLSLLPQKTKLLLEFHQENSGPVFIKLNDNEAIELRDHNGRSIRPGGIRQGDHAIVVYNGDSFIWVNPLDEIRTLEGRVNTLTRNQIRLIAAVNILMDSKDHGDFAGVVTIDFGSLSEVLLSAGLYDDKERKIFI